jgi:hypothetical protein
MLVGDVVLSAREAVPDLPGVLPAPGNEISFSAVSSAAPLPSGTYFLRVTYVNPWGETSGSAEFSQAVGAGACLQMTVAQNPSIALLSAINVYLGTSAGNEVQQYQWTSPQVGVFQITSALIPVPATPPLGNSAFLPDSGGSVAGAGQVFRWLTDALNSISALNGGIPDQSGLPTVYGQANYVINGDWQSLEDGWYDGYPLFMGSSGLVFRHNTLTALSGMCSATKVAEKLVVEIFAQPLRTAGAGVLSIAMTAASSTATAGAGLPGWVLPFGLAMLGTPANFEIISYTLNGNVLQSLVRALGGTNAQAWPVNTPVSELNFMFTGLRAPQLYSPGMSYNTLTVPSTWVPLLHTYMLARYRRIEQNEDEALKLMQSFQAGIKEATKKAPAVGDRQIQPQEQVAADVYPLLSRYFGGGIIP